MKGEYYHEIRMALLRSEDHRPVVGAPRRINRLGFQRPQRNEREEELDMFGQGFICASPNDLENPTAEIGGSNGSDSDLMFINPS